MKGIKTGLAVVYLSTFTKSVSMNTPFTFMRAITNGTQFIFPKALDNRKPPSMSGVNNKGNVEEQNN
jgi:hypothetical protein